MRALLYLKRDKEPIELREDEGEAAEKMMSDTAVGNDAPFIISKVVNCHKGDMAYVKWMKEKTYPDEPEKVDVKPETLEEKVARETMMQKNREEVYKILGTTPKAEKQKPTLSRKGLVEYKEKFGKEFVVPPNFEIIEDLPVNEKKDETTG